MTGKNKIIRALSHEEGPVPLDLGGFSTTGMHCSVVEQLREYYGLERHPVIVQEPYQMLGLVEDDLRQAMGADTYPLWDPSNMMGVDNQEFREWRTPWGQTVQIAKDLALDRQENGDVLGYAQGDRTYPPSVRMPASSYFFDALERQEDLEEDALNPEDNLQEFGPVSEQVLEGYRQKVRELSGTPYAITGKVVGAGLGDVAVVCGPMLPQPKGIRSVEEWYVSTLTRQEYIHEVFRRQTEIVIENLERIAPILGDTLQAIQLCGTDLGTQRAPFCSAETFASLYKPYYRIINDWIHANTSWKTFKHCCGSILPLIPELIDSGFDILNPVQWTADNMDAKELKRRFGNCLVFWGGGVDTQKTLPYGTPQDVRREVLEICDLFSAGGGFVFNAIHNIQAKVPVENVVAMIDAVHEFNGGR